MQTGAHVSVTCSALVLSVTDNLGHSEVVTGPEANNNQGPCITQYLTENVKPYNFCSLVLY